LQLFTVVSSERRHIDIDDHNGSSVNGIPIAIEYESTWENAPSLKSTRSGAVGNRYDLGSAVVPTRSATPVGSGACAGGVGLHGDDANVMRWGE
jgi:hypothetical protein